MKKLMLTLLVLAIAVPAMADVTISVVDNQDLTADIVIVADGDDADANGSLVAGISLEVSVDAGVIADVYNYKTSGESVVGDKGYGIYLGTITFTGGDPEDIADTGTPVAPADAPDAPGQVGSASIVLELGALYDQAVPEAAPDGTTTLCTIAVSEGCNAALAANATRGGVVLIGGGSVAAVLNGGPISGPVGCVGAADLAEWQALGEPQSWCADTQCNGDADDAEEQIGRNMRRVGYNDIAILLAGFNKAYAVGDAWIAADFTRTQEQIGRNQRRVGYEDIAVLLANFNQAVVGTDCND